MESRSIWLFLVRTVLFLTAALLTAAVVTEERPRLPEPPAVHAQEAIMNSETGVPDPPPIANSLDTFEEFMTSAAAGLRQVNSSTIRIQASDISWVTACADGRMVFSKLLEAGDSEELTFGREATLRSGNAGALELTVAGRHVAPMGPPGAIRMIRATARGYEQVTPMVTNTCAP